MYVSSSAPLPMNSETPLPTWERMKYLHTIAQVNIAANRAKAQLGCTAPPGAFTGESPIVQAQVANANSQIQQSGVYSPVPVQASVISSAPGAPGQYRGGGSATANPSDTPVELVLYPGQDSDSQCGPAPKAPSRPKRRTLTATLPQRAPGPKPLNANSAASQVASGAVGGGVGGGLILAVGEVNSAVTATSVAASAPAGFASLAPAIGLAGVSPTWGDAYQIGRKIRGGAQSFFANLQNNPLLMGVLIVFGVAGFGAAFEKGRRR